ncbi:hypothetical protein ACQKH7_07410 [Brevundimonas sp. NPDC029107]|uniref:hypothetical protein n=1 Tax=Brevundimonas sp. NPDC029107 TaxID=3390556 RepID=UPI003D063FA5
MGKRRQRPALGGSLPALLEALADQLDQMRPSSELVNKAVSLLESTPPSRFVEIDRQIRDLGRLYHHRYLPDDRLGGWLRLLARSNRKTGPSADLIMLNHQPALAPIFLSHGDGRVREAALDHLTEIKAPYIVCAIALRLNDWAGPVRYAAIECADRLLGATSPTVLAEAAKEILPRRSTWTRGDSALLRLDAAFARADVVQAIVNHLAASVTGPCIRILAEVSRTDVVDIWLEHLAFNAAQPNVRALAYRFLIEEEAAWPEGFEHVWIDKTYGMERRIRRYGNRSLSITTDRAHLIAAGAKDRAAAVRLAVADSLVRHRHSLPDPAGLAKELSKDKHPGVRLRAQFVLDNV